MGETVEMVPEDVTESETEVFVATVTDRDGLVTVVTGTNDVVP